MYDDIYENISWHYGQVSSEKRIQHLSTSEVLMSKRVEKKCSFTQIINYIMSNLSFPVTHSLPHPLSCDHFTPKCMFCSLTESYCLMMRMWLHYEFITMNSR